MWLHTSATLVVDKGSKKRKRNGLKRFLRHREPLGQSVGQMENTIEDPKSPCYWGQRVSPPIACLSRNPSTLGSEQTMFWGFHTFPHNMENIHETLLIHLRAQKAQCVSHFIHFHQRNSKYLINVTGQFF